MSDHDFLDAFEQEEAGFPQHGKREGKPHRWHIPEALIAIAVAALLAIVPFAAHADAGDEASASSNDSTASSADAASQASASASSTQKKEGDGLSVTKKKTSYANGKTIATSGDGARGIAVLSAGKFIGGDLTVTTKGTQAPALAALDAKAGISIVNSTFKTAGENSPLIVTTGTAELENVTGTSTAASIAEILNGGTLMVSNSTLATDYAGTSGAGTLVEGLAATSDADQAKPAAIAAFGPGADSESANAENADSAKSASKESSSASASSTESRKTSGADAAGNARLSETNLVLLQATGSTLKSAMASGSFFSFEGAQAKVVLSNTALDFNADAVNLISATAASSNSKTSSKGGASNVTFTNYGERLAGDVVADAASTLSLYLLEHSSWSGAASISTTSGSDPANANLTVNVDATSGWVVTANSTVTNLNLETGAKLVDAEGAAVRIVDADGNTLVDGASSVEVKVRGNFSTKVTTTSANTLEEAAIDRDAFDEKYETSTTFGANGQPTSPSIEDQAHEIAARVSAWFENL